MLFLLALPSNYRKGSVALGSPVRWRFAVGMGDDLALPEVTGMRGRDFQSGWLSSPFVLGELH